MILMQHYIMLCLIKQCCRLGTFRGAVIIYMSDQPFYLTGNGEPNGDINLVSDGAMGTVTWDVNGAAFYCRTNAYVSF